MITSRQNRRIKTIRSLRDCKGSHAFLEGPHLVGESLSSGIEVIEVLATPEWKERDEGKMLAASLAVEPLLVTESVLASLVDARSPQGVLAVVSLARSGVESLPIVDGGIYVLLEAVQDPGNLGALIRSAESTGAVGIGLSRGSAHPNHPKALRASAGSLLRVPVAVEAGADDLLAHLDSVAPTLVGLDAKAGGDLYQTDLTGTLVLALGSEGGGLSQDLRAKIDTLISIPSAPPVESLNVTVAGSVVLHELARRRSRL